MGWSGDASDRLARVRRRHEGMQRRHEGMQRRHGNVVGERGDVSEACREPAGGGLGLEVRRTRWRPWRCGGM
jgi:hypothetical protein